MKVTILTPQYPPMIGGVPTLIHDVARGLAATGDDVRVVTAGGSRAERATMLRAERGVTLQRLPLAPVPGLSAPLFALRVLLDLPRRRPDIIFCGVGWPFAAVGLLLRLVARLPYAVYVHSEELARPERSARTAYLFRLALNHCSAVLTNSRFTAARLRRLGGPRCRPICVAPGVDVERFAAAAPRAAEIRARHQLDGHPVLLTVARLVDRKGQDTVIRAMPEVVRQVPDVRYLIVGSGPAEARLRALAEECGVADRVIFAGRVSDEELPAYYQACDVFVMPTRYDPKDGEVEGFGIVFQEAGAAGKPVIAGRAGGTADAVEDGVTGLLVDPLDTNAVGDALVRLIQERGLSQQMGTSGRSKILFSDGLCSFITRLRAAMELD